MATNLIDTFLLKGDYIDESMKAVDTFADLKLISNTFEGLTVTVKNNGTPVVMWLVGGTKRYNWKVRLLSEYPSYSELTATTQEIVSAFKTTKYASRAFVLGTECVVQVDDRDSEDPNYGKLAKYWISKVDEDGTVHWERKIYGTKTYKNVTEALSDTDNLYVGQTIYMEEDYSGYTQGTYCVIANEVGDYDFEKFVTENDTKLMVEGDDDLEK